MTGEDVVKAAEMMRRWQQLHRLRSLVLGDEKGIIGIASALVGDPENATVADAAFHAMRDAATTEIERLIREVHAAAVALGVRPPFPASSPDAV